MEPAQDLVILLHGIWLRALTLHPLRKRLVEAGYEVETIDYPSVLGGPESGGAALKRRLERARERTVHVVGHSLGGMVALETARANPSLVSGRIVCLGSPLAGSRAARALDGRSSTRWMTGRSRDLLTTGVAACPDCLTVGVIAGSLPFGIGGFLAGLPSPHDGTVAVDETRLDGLSDHCHVAATHSGLLLSSEAARQAIAFLRDGRFTH